MENWRIYPPKVEFQQEGELGYSGTKQFEYILIPQSKAIEEVPEIEYAYFDPEQRQYETVTLEAIPVSVAPAEKPLESELFLGSSTSGDTQLEESRIPEALLPIRPEPGTLLQPGPGWMNPRFLITNGVFAVALLMAALFLRQKARLRNDNRLARRHIGSRKIRQYLQSADKSASDGDPAGFFPAARHAIQERVSHFANTPQESKTLVTSDCLDILRESDLPESIIEPCSEILNAADAFQFADATADQNELSRLNKSLRNLMTELNRFQK